MIDKVIDINSTKPLYLLFEHPTTKQRASVYADDIVNDGTPTGDDDTDYEYVGYLTDGDDVVEWHHQEQRVWVLPTPDEVADMVAQYRSECDGDIQAMVEYLAILNGKR